MTVTTTSQPTPWTSPTGDPDAFDAKLRQVLRDQAH